MTNFFAKNEKKIGCDLHIPKNNRNFAPQNRGVAQLVVYLVWDQVVARSSRVTPTIFNCFFFAKSVTVLRSFFCSLNFCRQKKRQLSNY